MPFLTYNGITIPVAKGGDMEPVVRGTRGRSPSNRYFLGRNGKVARRWRFQTIPLPMDQARILERALMHEGDHWQFALKTDPDGTSTLASDFASDHGAALTTATDVVASNRAADGLLVVNQAGAGVAPRESASGALATVAGTTNLLTAANANPNASTDLTAVGAPTLTTSTARRWKGAGCVKVDAAAGEGVTTAAVAVGAGPTTYQGAIHAIGDVGGETMQVRVTDDSAADSVDTSVTLLADKWTRIVLPHTSDGGTTSLSLRLLAQTSAAVFYVDGLSLEVNDKVTAWQDPAAGARAAPTLAYPVNIWDNIGKGSFTANVWVRYDNQDTSVARRILNVGKTGDVDRFDLNLSTGGTMTTRLRNVSMDWLSVAPATTLVADAWGMITVAYNAATPSLTLYENGVEVASDTTPGSFAPDLSDADFFTVGNFDGTGEGIGHIADLSIVPNVVPAATITQWYQGGTPTTPSGFATPALAQGDYLPSEEGPIAVYGQLTRAGYEGIHRATVFASNNRVVSFVLEEAL